MDKKLISIVLPVLNEEENIILCYEAILKVIQPLKEFDFEFVFTDNHSEDNTFAILRELAEKDKRVKVYRFSKNFGFQKSIHTGLSKTKGNAAIIFDCDLQDPPSLFIDFLRYWNSGYKVVYGIRRGRKESFLLHLTRKAFYRIVNALGEDYLPPDVGDFRLLDRVIIDHIKAMNDYRPYLRGAIAQLGYKQMGIEYDRDERKLGESKFPLRALVSLAIDGIVSQSVLPLKLGSYMGFFVSAITVIGVFFYGGLFLFGHVDWPRGFTTTTVLILFSASLNAMFLGIIGEYIGRIYEQLKQRPLTIIEESIND